MKKQIIITIIICCLNNMLNAQTPDITGVWVLKQRQSLAGPDYSNSIPKLMVITLANDSLLIKRTYEGPANNSYAIDENLPINGSTVEVMRTISKRRSTLQKGSAPNIFSINVTYRDAKTGKQTSADFVEQWKLDPTGKELIVKKSAKEADGVNWSVEGIYEFKTAEQLALEGAKGNGIQFVENLSWDQIKEKAKAENKFIFVDCYATWCLPCKKMEADIFPLNIVGAAANDKFLAVRLQMDTTKKDDEAVKKWYPVAHSFLTNFQIVGYPSFLFFDPTGNIVHKALGTFKSDEFIELLNNATDPNKQYYTLLHAYQAGENDHEKMYQLLVTAKKLSETNVAQDVLKTYKREWLSKVSVESLLSEKYLRLAVDFQQELIRDDGSKGNFFQLMYRKGKEVDAILNLPGFSAFHVNGIISQEEIANKIYKNEQPVPKPQWEEIKGNIQGKYSGINADKLLLDEQIRYSQNKKDWNGLVKYLVTKIERHGPLSLGQQDGSGSDNAITNVLLPHCEDKVILNKAVGWLEQIIHSKAYMYPIGMVYGNYGAILYKSGKRHEGIEAFEKQLNAIGYKSPADLDKDPRFKEKVNYLNRMKRGEKIDSTWKPYVFN